MLRYCISVNETFSYAINFTVSNTYGKDAVVQIATVFQAICHVDCRGVLLNTTFYTFMEQRFSEPLIAEIHQL